MFSGELRQRRKRGLQFSRVDGESTFLGKLTLNAAALLRHDSTHNPALQRYQIVTKTMFITYTASIYNSYNVAYLGFYAISSRSIYY